MTDTLTTPTITALPADRIRPGNNDRARFDPAELATLAASIDASGLAQPPTVRPMPDGTWQIVAGERRFRAVTTILGWSEVPCIIRQLDDDQASDIMLAENEARADLDPIEQAKAYASRMAARGLTAAELSGRIGIPAGRITSRVRLLNLDTDIAHLVSIGDLGLELAGMMVDLDHNRQHLALAGLQSGLDKRGLRMLVARLQAEQDQEVMFDASSFFQIEEYVIGAQQEAAVEQLGLFAEQVTQATRLRDDAIVTMKRQGMTLRAIGAATGMSHAGVARVLARQ